MDLNFSNFFTNTSGEKNLNINDISRGDIIFNPNFLTDFSHAMFVIGKDGNNVKICANTNNRCDYPINFNEISAVLKTNILLN